MDEAKRPQIKLAKIYKSSEANEARLKEYLFEKQIQEAKAKPKADKKL